MASLARRRKIKEGTSESLANLSEGKSRLGGLNQLGQQVSSQEGCSIVGGQLTREEGSQGRLLWVND